MECWSCYNIVIMLHRLCLDCLFHSLTCSIYISDLLIGQWHKKRVVQTRYEALLWNFSAILHCPSKQSLDAFRLSFGKWLLTHPHYLIIIRYLWVALISPASYIIFYSNIVKRHLAHILRFCINFPQTNMNWEIGRIFALVC